MTTEHEASRTLVKSPPELWAECSDAGSLARHLGEFGEITITRLEPETTVAWEGEHASGTVRIEPSGWGTRVTLTAQARSESVEVPADAPEPVAEEAVPPTDASSVEAFSEPPEETHEKVEETLEDPDTAPVAETGAFRIRWRRMRERMRGALRAAEAEVAPEPETSILAEAPPSLEPEPDTVSEPQASPPPEPEAPPPPEPEAEPDLNPEVILTAALDSLGQAHHRPFSRA